MVASIQLGRFFREVLKAAPLTVRERFGESLFAL